LCGRAHKKILVEKLKKYKRKLILWEKIRTKKKKKKKIYKENLRGFFSKNTRGFFEDFNMDVHMKKI
jgi:hypothetical protein